MQPFDITKMPEIDPTSAAALAAMGIPDCMVDSVQTAAKGVREIYETLKEKQDPQPTMLIAGWNPAQPYVDIIGIDGQWLRNSETKQQLADSIQQQILTNRNQGKETFGVTFISAIWAKSTNDSDLARVELSGIAKEPDRVECCYIEVIWQDGHAALIASVTRPENSGPVLGEWRVMISGWETTRTARSRWQMAIAPALAAKAYADAILASLEGAADSEEGGEQL